MHPSSLVLAVVTALSCTLACGSAPSDATSFAALASEVTDVSDDAPTQSALPLSGVSTCPLPPGCRHIVTSGFMMNACCTEKVSCGLDLTPFIGEWDDTPKAVRDVLLPVGFERDKPCVAPSTVWKPWFGQPEQRVAGDGADILVTPACSSRALFGFLIPGCCLPSGVCGLSTHGTLSDLRAFANPGVTIPAMCGDSSTWNRLLKQTAIATMADIPEVTGRCDYAGLDAKLPPVVAEPEE